FLQYRYLHLKSYYLYLPPSFDLYFFQTYTASKPVGFTYIPGFVKIKSIFHSIPAGVGQMNDTWGLLHSGHDDAAVNMAMDEALLNWHSEGKIPPVLRFYGWSTPTLSVGHFQKVDRTIDLD